MTYPNGFVGAAGSGNGVTGYFGDGTAGAPSIAFATDADGTGTGLYRNAADNIGISTAGSLSWQWNSAGHLAPSASGTRDLGGTGTQVRDLFVSRSIEGSSTKTLVETSATAYVTVAVANSTGSAGRIVYTIRASDATDAQAVSGEAFFSCVATSAGAVTCATLSYQHVLNPVSTGTLTNTTTQATGTNLVTFSANATSSLTQTTLRIDYRVELMGNTAAVTGL